MHWFVPTLHTAFGGKSMKSRMFQNRQRFCIKHNVFIMNDLFWLLHCWYLNKCAGLNVALWRLVVYVDRWLTEQILYIGFGGKRVGCLLPRKLTPGTHWVRGWMVKKLYRRHCPRRSLNSDPSVSKLHADWQSESAVALCRVWRDS